jgi:hypothetical protein
MVIVLDHDKTQWVAVDSIASGVVNAKELGSVFTVNQANI